MVDAFENKGQLSFEYDEVTDISESATEQKSSRQQSSKSDNIESVGLFSAGKEDLAHAHPESLTPMSSISDTNDENNEEAESTFFPNFGFFEDELEDDVSTIDNPTREVIDDKLTPQRGEESEDDEREFPEGTFPPHLLPVDSRASTAQETSERVASVRGPRDGYKGGPQNPPPLQQPVDSPEGDDDEDDEDDLQAPQPEGAYDPAEYENLEVSSEIKELFNFISRYTPQNIELEHRLGPFIPDYIPAVGDIDAFIKILRPDGQSSSLGLTVLDEPSARQSDATVLDLQLRSVAKQSTARAVVVKTVENGEKNGKIIEKWMRDISDLHRAKPPPTVHYAKRMPDIDTLMQEWPGEVEDLLHQINLPSAALQVELPQYVDIICSLLDIPVYKNRIQSLHVLFTLFSVFKNSNHFKHLAEENVMDSEDSAPVDRLVL